MSISDDEEWWHRAVIYEIALISFQDSNGDGRGDLPGLLRRIDYLKWLGIDAIWLTPIFSSPKRDFGYDISDFCAIDPAFGSLDDFDRLIQTLHDAGIRLILDFVPNHTSDEHSWFQESRASRSNDKSDWYLWAEPGEDGGPPNNWLSRFGGSAWEWSEARQQYYCHTFLREQPDLNWRNPQVQSALSCVMRFWLARGVDGFRVDASAVLIKDALLRDNPPAQGADGNTPPPQRFTPVFTDDRPEAMGCIELIRGVVDEYRGRVLCGEVQGKIDRIGHFYHGARPRLHLPLNFALLDTPWDIHSLQACIDAYCNALPEHAWPDWVIGGHDKQRIASKIGEAQARVLAMLLMTLRGTPFLYMGDELGKRRAPVPRERVDDPFEKLVPGFDLGRDPERTPMRWDDSAVGGFTTGAPWLPMLDDRSCNVAQQQDDECSILQLYRRLIALRRKYRCLAEGAYEPVRARSDVLCFNRRLGETRMLIGLNIASEPRRWACGAAGLRLLSTHLDRPAESVGPSLLLRANEGVIVLEAAGDRGRGGEGQDLGPSAGETLPM